ncbi:hypothetical protein ACQP26_19685 [Micromonospora sp. CA-248089]|uniref:hypothetical protein n=1 Tax=Micromonospora sp. CA-248089 TaxID=3239960 RepID=UPI003D8ECFAE
MSAGTKTLTTEEVENALADLPTTRVGTEMEYKWLLDLDSFPQIDGEDVLSRLQDLVPPPAGMKLGSPFVHTQSSVYFDDDWLLTERDLTLKIIVNHGSFSNVSWICAKQTISWIDGCRDALEISERITPGEATQIIRSHAALPIDYIDRQCGKRVNLQPYATATQVRHKLPFHGPDGSILQLTFDRTTNRSLASEETCQDTWIEIETPHSDLRSRGGLIGWAAAMTELLQKSPHQMSKSEREARRARRDSTIGDQS